MKIITINLPERYVEAIQVLKDLKLYPSRSEALRIALRDFLAKEVNFVQEIELDEFKNIMRSKE